MVVTLFGRLRVAALGGCNTWSDRITMEMCRESQFLESDRDGGCNLHRVVGGNEHTCQGSGSTAARPEAKAEKGPTVGAAATAESAKPARPTATLGAILGTILNMQTLQ